MSPTPALLFGRLEASGVRYVILRNYEQLCDRAHAGSQATDIDLVIATGDLPKWRPIAASLARDADWDALTECAHFTRSSRREHDIQIFRFYRYADGAFLQVDLFHAYLVWGLPFLNEEEMLEGRVHDAARGLTRIDPIKENTFRLLQLQGLIGWEHSVEKMARYRERVLRFEAERRDEFRAYLESRFPGYAERILEALARADWKAYRRTMTRAKAAFALRFAARDPISAVRLPAARLAEARKRYWTEPCGQRLPIGVDGPRTRERVVRALEALKRSNVIDHWVARRPRVLPDKISMDVREQGGLVVEWTEAAKGELRIADADSEETIRRRLLHVLVAHHHPLYLRSRDTVSQATPAVMQAT